MYVVQSCKCACVCMCVFDILQKLTLPSSPNLAVFWICESYFQVTRTDFTTNIYAHKRLFKKPPLTLCPIPAPSSTLQPHAL